MVRSSYMAEQPCNAAGKRTKRVRNIRSDAVAGGTCRAAVNNKHRGPLRKVWATISEAWEMKQFFGRLLLQKQRGSAEEQYLLVEHPHVYTLGKAATVEPARQRAVLAKSALPLVPTAAAMLPTTGWVVASSRSGTDQVSRDHFHEEALYHSRLQHHGRPARRATGVWTRTRTQNLCDRCKASFRDDTGSRTSNVTTDLNFFSHINPWFYRQGVTSIDEIPGLKPSLEEVGQRCALWRDFKIRIKINQSYVSRKDGSQGRGNRLKWPTGHRAKFLGPCQPACQRGIETEEKGLQFLISSKPARPIPDEDMRKAVERVDLALSRGEASWFTAIDVDGTTSCGPGLFVSAPARSQSVDVLSRPLHRRYGVSYKAIDHAQRKGVGVIAHPRLESSDEKVSTRRAGIDMIICDHHLLGERFPAVVQSQTGRLPYPFKELSGCG